VDEEGTDVHAEIIGLVQAAVLRHIESNPERSYGFAIAEDVSKAIGRDFSDAQIYVSLRRLEDRGLIAKREDYPAASTPKMRGRPRKFYLVTSRGRKALQEAGVYTLIEGFPNGRKASNEGILDKPLVPSMVG
jgi:DNA-binding PadR family transcriptional regulator